MCRAGLLIRHLRCFTAGMSSGINVAASLVAQGLHPRVLVRRHQAVIGPLDLLEPLLRLLHVFRVLVRMPYLQRIRAS